MKIRDVRCAGLRGATPEGGWRRRSVSILLAQLPRAEWRRRVLADAREWFRTDSEKNAESFP